MYFRDLLCFFINILNLKKFNIQKSDFFPQKKCLAQHARFLLCVVHKVHMAQNIIFKGIVLPQIYTSIIKNISRTTCPCIKKIKTQLLPLFVFQNHPSLTGIFQMQQKFCHFSCKIGLF